VEWKDEGMIALMRKGWGGSNPKNGLDDVNQPFLQVIATR
jgi:hypothetical protein